ncbi:hypothetical protein [Deinococcus sp. QL22]|uniref:hypothetical protein n=1 Tax=Deinococcus sp. QL22 TaxID=2939437 RepID=UPI0020172F0E|nr:hypothetical protein [Deinococcus sp. QL22]UQN06281.1 hypothetical protein M1R55_15695 [Deinococcus sp. QL22]
MSDDEQFGRNSQRPSETSPEVTLSDADKARIRAEEEYRAQMRAQVAPPTPVLLTKKQEQAATKAQTSMDVAEMNRKNLERRAALTPKQRRTENLRAVAVLAVLILGLAFLFRSCSTAAPAAPLPLSEISRGTVTTLCEESAQERLKVPSSAQFVAGQYEPYFDGTKWMYVGGVNAENSFGAAIRNQFLCTVTGETYNDARAITNLIPLP